MCKLYPTGSRFIYIISWLRCLIWKPLVTTNQVEQLIEMVLHDTLLIPMEFMLSCFIMSPSPYREEFFYAVQLETACIIGKDIKPCLLNAFDKNHNAPYKVQVIMAWEYIILGSPWVLQLTDIFSLKVWKSFTAISPKK